MPEATERAVATQADGVGLLRIEHIVLGLGEHPLELLDGGREDEYVDYLVDNIRTVAQAFHPRPVWMRTLDAPTDEFRGMPGGDREPNEANPMLGWRGIRRGLEQPVLLEAEFKALKRLHEEGSDNVGIMLPLVQDPREIREAKAIARSVGLDPDGPSLDFGIMIEIPASALIIDELLDEGLDFVSFGTNDLTQYTLAVDRNNENVAGLFDEFHPAVGRLIEMVIKACRARGVSTSICGQAGSDPKFVEKLIHWGITSVSANIDAVAEVRRTVARVEQRMVLDSVRETR
jgi:pyruvate,water dikinase